MFKFRKNSPAFILAIIAVCIDIIVGRKELYSFFKFFGQPISMFGLVPPMYLQRLISFSFYLLLMISLLLIIRLVRNFFRNGTIEKTWMFFCVSGLVAVMYVFTGLFNPSISLLEYVLKLLLALFSAWFFYKLVIFSYYTEKG